MSSFPKPPMPGEWLKKQTRLVDTQHTLSVPEEVAAAVEVEAWLQRRAVMYAPARAIPMHLIDEKKSRTNQARKDPLVAESVERYTTAWKAGAKFPPIVVYPLGGKLIIIDGNNRQSAARRAGREFINGIIISEQTPSELIQLLTVEANARHGVTPELSWRLKQAFQLISLGFSDSEAAEASAVTALQIKNARAVQEADQRARTLKIYGFTDLPATSRQYLNSLKDEPIFHAAAKLAAGSKLSIEQVRELCRTVKAERSEAARLGAIAEASQALTVEVATKKALQKGVSAPKQALVAGIGLLLKCDTGALVSSVMTTHDRDVINNRLAEVANKVVDLMAAMESLEQMGEE